jgi:hypothetical protein
LRFHGLSAAPPGTEHKERSRQIAAAARIVTLLPYLVRVIWFLSHVVV